VSLYVRQLAYLHAPIETPSKKNLKKSTTTQPATRMQRFDDQGVQPPLPDAGPAAHLVGYLLDAGPTGHGGMGPTPLTHSDIVAWQANTGVELTAWEARTLRALSVDWIASSHDATQPDCAAPWVELQADTRERVAERVRSLFGARARQQPKGAARQAVH
jgi:peptidoglycan hydrolase-like protein with peptidoglycan-binding domain